MFLFIYAAFELNSFFHYRDIEHTLPWFFTAQAILCVQNNGCSHELDVVKQWMQDEEKKLALNVTNLFL